jgi:hypothetical protein
MNEDLGPMDLKAVDDVPIGYKVWVFGSKLVGILAFAVGIEMLTLHLWLWAAVLLLAGAVIVVAPVRSPEEWIAMIGRWSRHGG